MIQIYLRRIVSIVALALVALAITQPVSATDLNAELDPITEAVAGAVDTTTTEISGAVDSTVEPVPEADAPAVKEVVKSVTDEVSIASEEEVPSAAIQGPATSAGAAGGSAATASATGASGATGRGEGSDKVAQQGSSEGDDRDELLAAGNDVVTTLVMGTGIERNAGAPKKAQGAPLALTGTSILMGLVVGLVLVALGVGTGTAARQSGTAVA